MSEVEQDARRHLLDRIRNLNEAETEECKAHAALESAQEVYEQATAKLTQKRQEWMDALHLYLAATSIPDNLSNMEGTVPSKEEVRGESED